MGTSSQVDLTVKFEFGRAQWRGLQKKAFETRTSVRLQMRCQIPRTTETGDQARTLTIDIDLSDDAPAIPLVYSLDSDPRTAAEEFGRDYSLSDNYINQIEAFIKAHLEVARDG
ncbi:hypothetical protein CI109_105538 [Kwoniella shandongensis]|uniref:PFU domain-containing protein n=1 Tax=Kwoniella shandongensis TaxID=1734106 RepID=A0AAJ8MZG5_9TREE